MNGNSAQSTQILIIGAGIAGLSIALNLARTSKRLGKHLEITIIEKRDGPGGTWSNAAVYPGLITNNGWKAMLIEDNDKAMAREFESVKEYGAGPGSFRATGPAMTRHMEQLEAKVKAAGVVIHYKTEVDTVTKGKTGGWSIVYHSLGSDATRNTFADKLVVASGSFSSPLVPSFAHEVWKEELEETVSLPLCLHTQQLSRPQVQKPVEDAESVVVIGASKSAMDAAERFALAGKTVSLVVKNAPYLAPPAFFDKKGVPSDAQPGVSSRIFCSFIPYYRDPISGLVSSGGRFCSALRLFMHGTWLGGFLQRFFETKVTGIFSEWNQWDASPNNLAMKPDTPMTWMEASAYPCPEQLPELFKQGKIQVFRGAAVGIREGQAEKKSFDLEVLMNDGATVQIPGNLLIFGTGWRTGELPFFDRALSNELGMPLKYQHVGEEPDREHMYHELDEKYLDELLSNTRTLRNMPKEWSLPTYGARAVGAGSIQKIAPFRLYRLMVPLSHLTARDIVFPGIATNKANTVCADVQAHWITDYLLDNMPGPLPTYSKAAEEISKHVVWSRRLFGPAQGALASWLGTAWFEYCGRLCADLKVAADGEGLTGCIDSASFQMEKKRIERDWKR